MPTDEKPHFVVYDVDELRLRTSATGDGARVGHEPDAEPQALLQAGEAGDGDVGRARPAKGKDASHADSRESRSGERACDVKRGVDSMVEIGDAMRGDEAVKGGDGLNAALAQRRRRRPPPLGDSLHLAESGAARALLAQVCCAGERVRASNRRTCDCKRASCTQCCLLQN